VEETVMRFLAVPALLAAAFVFACGGDDDSNDQPTGESNGSVPTQAANNGTGATGGGSSNAAAKTAVVTIGEERYEFTLNRDCRALFGTLVGVGESSDGRDAVVNIQIPPEGGIDGVEPSIRVDDKGKNLDWRAGGDVISEMAGVSESDSQVDDYKNDGKAASGAATFLDLYAVLKGEVKPVQGTFEFACE
jgi:hypothetical protein